ncbi:DUF3577 domain-containing protein [Parachitinimonas caeni]|uniref:DUF3577 domain-containing protein n=1 Tax=Parachitinimonas caeni TaxID=3031301 RepID=A0ABT7E349_9NEIS|nr:DUF3577 domain-containing protein [Parachitinimonas caeni]MDK2126753.1 DUF3577 domain-containing protein [Parachitinimonas caeni]
MTTNTNTRYFDLHAEISGFFQRPRQLACKGKPTYVGFLAVRPHPQDPAKVAYTYFDLKVLCPEALKQIQTITDQVGSGKQVAARILISDLYIDPYDFLNPETKQVEKRTLVKGRLIKMLSPIELSNKRDALDVLTRLGGIAVRGAGYLNDVRDLGNRTVSTINAMHGEPELDGQKMKWAQTRFSLAVPAEIKPYIDFLRTGVMNQQSVFVSFKAENFFIDSFQIKKGVRAGETIHFLNGGLTKLSMASVAGERVDFAKILNTASGTTETQPEMTESMAPDAEQQDVHDEGEYLPAAA